MSSPIIRRFADMLNFLSRGRFIEQCDDHLAAAIAALQGLPDEKGSVTITLQIKLAFQSGMIEVSPVVKSKLPEQKALPGTPFWTHDGGLSMQHPSQMDLGLGPRAADPADRQSKASK